MAYSAACIESRRRSVARMISMTWGCSAVLASAEESFHPGHTLVWCHTVRWQRAHLAVPPTSIVLQCMLKLGLQARRSENNDTLCFSDRGHHVLQIDQTLVLQFAQVVTFIGHYVQG